MTTRRRSCRLTAFTASLELARPGAPPGRDKLQLVMAGPGGVWIICPGGEHIRTIKVPERVTNVAGATLTA